MNNICIFADQQKVKPVAIISPMEPALKKLAKDNGIVGELESIVRDDKLQALVLKDLLAIGKRGGLAGQELIEGVVLTDEEWTPQTVCYMLVCLF